MIEAWGRGIERIMEVCRSAGVPEPLLRDDQTDYGWSSHFKKNQR